MLTVDDGTYLMFFIARDSNILEKCGPDAVQYLSFQRYLLVYLSIITVLSIAVVLPINFMGELGQFSFYFTCNMSSVWVNL